MSKPESSLKGSLASLANLLKTPSPTYQHSGWYKKESITSLNKMVTTIKAAVIPNPNTPRTPRVKPKWQISLEKFLTDVKLKFKTGGPSVNWVYFY
jgi:hypothetical protein